MTAKPLQEHLDQPPRGAASSVQHLTSRPFVSALYEDSLQSSEEGLQEQLWRLQKCVCELLIKNEQLRILLESASKSPG
jgi:hypothetical protein